MSGCWLKKGVWFWVERLIFLKLNRDHEKKKAQLSRLEEQLRKLEMSRTDKEEGKEIALGTSKLNYLDPRISVAW